MRPSTHNITQMAREAGISVPWDQEPIPWGQLERFAALVAAAAVREKSAEYRLGWNDNQKELVEHITELVEVIEAAITSGDWKVDGACDPSLALQRAKRVIGEASPESQLGDF